MREDAGIDITVKLTPKAAKNAIVGWEEDLLGERVLKVILTTAPEKGKANKALIALLAKSWKVPKTAITITRGETNRIKKLHINGLGPEHPCMRNSIMLG